LYNVCSTTPRLRAAAAMLWPDSTNRPIEPPPVCTPACIAPAPPLSSPSPCSI
jgi:hypothetical protein